MSVCERYCRVLHEISIRNLKMGILKTKTINKNKKKIKKRKKNEQADIIDIIWTQFLLLLFEFFFLRGLMGWFY